MTENKKTPSLMLVGEASSGDIATDHSALIKELLMRAKDQMLKGNLIAPSGNNALETYRKIMSLDSENEEAFEGINMLKRQLMEANTREEIPAPPSPAKEESITEQISGQASESSQTNATDRTPESHDSLEEKSLEIPSFLRAEKITQPAHVRSHQSVWPVLVVNILIICAVTGGLIIFEDPNRLGKYQKFLPFAHNTTSDDTPAEDTTHLNEPDSQLKIVTGESSRDGDVVGTENENNGIPAPSSDDTQTELAQLLSLSQRYLRDDQLVSRNGEDALTVLQQILDRYPEHTEALLGMETLKQKLFAKANSAQNEKKWNIAQEQFESLLRIESENQQYKSAMAKLDEVRSRHERIETLLTRAQEFLQKEQYAVPGNNDALHTFKQVLEIDPNNQQAMAGITTAGDKVLELAMKAKDAKQWDQARNYLRQALIINPENLIAQKALEEVAIGKAKQTELNDWLKKAQERLAAGQLVEPVGGNAAFLFAQVLQHDPSNVAAQKGLDILTKELLLKAGTAQEQKNWSEARYHLDTALRIQPDNASIHNAISALTEEQKEAENVSTLLAQAQNMLSSAKTGSDTDVIALEYFKNILSLDAGNKDAAAGIERVKKRFLDAATQATESQQWDNADSHLKTVLSIDAENEEAIKLTKIVNKNQKETQERSAHLAEADRILGSDESTLAEYQNAYAAINTVLDREPENPKALLNKRILIEKLWAAARSANTGDNQEIAQRYYEFLQQINPSDQQARIALDRLLREKNKQIEIERLLTLAKEHFKSERFTEPVGDNAFTFFKQVLAIDPENETARTGIDTIETKLRQLATTAQKNKTWDIARGHFQSLLIINPQNKNARTALDELATTARNASADVTQTADAASNAEASEEILAIIKLDAKPAEDPISEQELLEILGSE